MEDQILRMLKSLMEINLSDIKIVPDLDSIVRAKISDEEYFGPKYSNYTSNSRLKLIDPEHGGSPSKYKAGFKENTQDFFALGSSVHQLTLEPEEYSLGPDIGKPTAKLGLVIDKIKQYRDCNYKIIDAISSACNKVDYYKGNITPTRIKKIIKEGLNYYLHKPTDNTIILPSKDRETCIKCVENLRKNRAIQNLINPKDIFGDPIESYNEDAFFMDFIASHNNKEYRLKLKLKIDNWSIDVSDKKITLNDLKTTSKRVSDFMGTSFINLAYYQQFALYLYVLLKYCEKEYLYNKDDWSYDCNVLVVGTRGDYETEVYKVFDAHIKNGHRKFCKLLKMVAYCEMYGYNDDYMFM